MEYLGLGLGGVSYFGGKGLLGWFSGLAALLCLIKRACGLSCVLSGPQQLPT